MWWEGFGWFCGRSVRVLGGFVLLFCCSLILFSNLPDSARVGLVRVLSVWARLNLTMGMPTAADLGPRTSHLGPRTSGVSLGPRTLNSNLGPRTPDPGPCTSGVGLRTSDLGLGPRTSDPGPRTSDLGGRTRTSSGLGPWTSDLGHGTSDVGPRNRTLDLGPWASGLRPRTSGLGHRNSDLATSESRNLTPRTLEPHCQLRSGDGLGLRNSISISNV